MKLQLQLERWQCAVTAFAMALDVPVTDLIRDVGHDGGSIIFPDLPEPGNRHGHSIYELIWAAVNLGYAVTPIPLHPEIKPASDPTRASFPSELIPEIGSGFRTIFTVLSV